MAVSSSSSTTSEIISSSELGSSIQNSSSKKASSSSKGGSSIKVNTTSSKPQGSEITEQSAAAFDTAGKTWPGEFQSSYMNFDNELFTYLGKYNSYYSIPSEEKVIYLTASLLII
jgi:hypothetical protein